MILIDRSQMRSFGNMLKIAETEKNKFPSPELLPESCLTNGAESKKGTESKGTIKSRSIWKSVAGIVKRCTGENGNMRRNRNSLIRIVHSLNTVGTKV